MTETVDPVFTEVRRIIAQQAMMEPERITPDSTPDGLGLDSLALVEIVFAIEEAFDISVPYNANEPTESDFDISTVGAAAGAVRRLLAEKGA